MPSWNVHIAHVERLLDDKTARLDAVKDHDAFVLGNLVPDIYVGYMVPDVSHKIPYRDTHFANPDFVPAPDASLFYRRYVKDKDASDVTLGAWCHLLCDHYYNLRTTQYIARIGVKPGERTRIRKQADFDLYGHTLSISCVPQLTKVVLGQCASFEQYRLEERDLRGAIRSAGQIVNNNRLHHFETTPDYDLLTADFFLETSTEVDSVLREALECCALGQDASHLGNPPS